MAPVTKKRAREKLATLRVGVGYPDRWVNYAGLEDRAGRCRGNAARARLYRYRQQGKIGGEVDTGEWWMVPQTVNAVNLPLQNALNFPAAILQAPLFDPAASDALNYGATGAVVAHEISHSFDDQGANRCPTARWWIRWTPEDRTHFEEAGKQLVLQGNACAFPDAHVNGALTLSEISRIWPAWRRLTTP